MLAALARLASRRPWRVVAVAAAFVVLALVVGAPGLGSLTSQGFDDRSREGVRARDAISAATGAESEPGVIALIRPGAPVLGRAGRAAVLQVERELRALPAVARVVGPFSGGGPSLISRDGRAGYLAAYLRSDDDAGQVMNRFRGDSRVTLGGGAVVRKEANDIVGQDLLRAEILAFPILFLISLWVFRGVVAALLPPVIGGVVIVGGFLGLSLVNHVHDISVYAINLVTGLGLGLAIDESLLMVSRYREEIAASGPGAEALRRTLMTAGRSVLFSTLTVAAALSALTIFPIGFLFSMGIGGMIVALLAAVASVVLLPAVLMILGPRVNALAPRRWRRATEEADRPVTSGFWYRLSHAVMRWPGPIAALTAGGLILLGLPALGLRFTTVDDQVLPRSVSARQVGDALRTEFPQDLSAPILIAVRAAPGPASGTRLEAYARRVAAVPGVVGATPPQYLGSGTWEIQAVAGSPPLAGRTQDVVREIRGLPAPAPALVGGLTAGFIDNKASLAARLPWAVAWVAIATMLVLWLMTGSVLIPIKAVIMNFLTLSATFGLLVLIFQDGNLEGPLGYRSLGSVDATQPVLLAALAFGLSTDYAVFLLSRIKEAHDGGTANREAVAFGLQRTGRIVTAAAVLFCVAIGAFATSRVVILKELGVGTAIAVLIDATIIRALLVPSLMELLGEANWWAPGPLRRLHRRIGVSEV
jgi:RND superfamily putative drug exporter